MDPGVKNFPKEKIDLRGSTDSTNEAWKPMAIKEDQLPSFWKIISQKQWRVLFIVYPVTIYHLRFFLPMLVLFYVFFRQGASYTGGLFKEYLLWRFKRILLLSRSKENLEIKSLRKIVKDDTSLIPTDSEAMKPLRQGR